MKYKEILTLNDYFQPVYDLKNEKGMYWKQFIPNEKFNNVLSSILNSLESNKVEERQPIWLQGTYGTGKSHATAVIKHLLYDNEENINDYDIENTQLKYRLESFRNKSRVFPVVLKGTSNIYDNRTFALVIEKAVKDSLKRENIKINTKTDFDEIISKLRSNNINWEKIFKGTDLEVYGSKEDIIAKLERKDISILTKIEDILSKEGIHFNKENIVVWLEDVIKELKEKKIADYLMIYWDEFTGIFELPKSNIILSELQNIAELSINKEVYLFIVSHRKPHQTDLSKDDVDKILGRFKVFDYSMEPVTTYHVINATIKKTEKVKWEKLRNKYVSPLKNLITQITGSEGINVQKSLENLFPIHPYTAYLATFIARNIGSTERSIFKFLYDDTKGFKKFIEQNPSGEDHIFLSADYLWDFFYEDFHRSGNEKVISVLERFKLYKNSLENHKSEYLNVFKGILLLNILYKVMETTESSLVNPSEKNIKNIFKGCLSEKELDNALKFIDDKQIINKTPDDLYILTSSGLPQIEIEKEKEKLSKVYQNIDSILNKNQKDSIVNSIKNSILRETEIVVMDNNLKEHLIRGKLDKSFKKDYTIPICLFLGNSNQELNQLKNKLKKISKETPYENIIFTVSDTILNNKDYNLFLEYNARAIVADKHNYAEDRIINEEYAKKIIDKWVDQLKSGYINWILNGNEGNELMGQFSKKINSDFSKQIFNLGLENIKGTQKNINIWHYTKSKKAIEIFLFSNNREEIESKTSSGLDKFLREILKDSNGDFIVNSNLEFKKEVSDDHPLKNIQNRIKESLEKARITGNFNLGTELRFLIELPIGLYPNMINLGAFSFIMREYSGKLFASSTGIPIQKEAMRDKILQLFDFWEKGKGREKLEVRFGSEDEEKLINVLTYLFDFKDITSLTNTRWEIRNWIKKVGYPIWIFKYSKSSNEKTKKALESIFQIIKSVEKDLTEEKIVKHLDSIELAKYDLKLLFENDPELLFGKWLESIKNIDITTEEYNEVFTYLHENMQEEVASWTEGKTRESLKDWEISKLKNTVPEGGTTPTIVTGTTSGTNGKTTTIPKGGTTPTIVTGTTSGTNGETTTIPKGGTTPTIVTGTTSGTQTTLEQFEEKIESCDGIRLKKAVIKAIAEQPEIIPIIDRHLDD